MGSAPPPAAARWPQGEFECVRADMEREAKRAAKLEAKLGDIESQQRMKQSNLNKTNDLIAEKERVIESLTQEKSKLESLYKTDTKELAQLRVDILNLKHEKEELAAMVKRGGQPQQQQKSGSLDSNNDSQMAAKSTHELIATIQAQNEQIQKLSDDRLTLTEQRQEALATLSVVEHDLLNQKEALEIAMLNFNVEKRNLVQDNEKFKTDVAELVETKRRLQREVDELKGELSDKSYKIERANSEKERMDKEKEEMERQTRNYESELRKL